MQHYACPESSDAGLLEPAITLGFGVISGTRLSVQSDGGDEKVLQTRVATCNF